MDAFQAIILGIVQGITEFLPISSTGHIRVIPALAGWPDPGAPFTAAIQLGTLLAVLIYFRSELALAFRGWVGSFWREKGTPLGPDAKMGWAIFWGTIPISILGFALKDQIEGDFRSLYVVAGMLIGIGLLMGAAEMIGSKKRALDSVRPADGLWVGLWQCIALIPGASRSGSTMTGAMFFGFDRSTAAKFSFLLSVPAIFLAGVFQIAEHRDVFFGPQAGVVILANVAAFISGYASIAFLLKFLATKSSWIFIIYRFLLGVALLILLQQGILQPMDGEAPTKSAKNGVHSFVCLDENQSSPRSLPSGS